ncbi:MAG: recombination mediator RecR [candidate division KSB1 bacterium]|nr:recombination mediator RecR [candidate division KSB1 bacterium]MDZ7335609.1 recombination mediator RecR [candidate division KSB1 bacterium]MDZ7357579.1 recombination mediator RecR [candidate division KSB1 bacterium]MDZ7377542.1 recombination mediator RecR [candidate division KSB1 bacterium]MDZ7399763.1 recombination mediator RecR [candidate division KSB1 bacterium]
MQRAVDELSKLPGIGKKSAQRLVFYLLKIPREEVIALAKSLVEVKDKASYCSVCFTITETNPCAICTDERRDRTTICVVEEANDVIALEKTGEYRGLYHVLGGALSPLDGIGPDDLKIKELLARLTGDVKEVILANNPNVEGEATALYLSKLIKPLGIKITRIARGIPVGTDLEYADEITLMRALEGRISY